MRRILPRLVLLSTLLAAAAGRAANTQISTEKPVINFRLPSFNADGQRAWLIRGSEALLGRQGNTDVVDIKELTLSVFSGKADDKIVTMILSPTAHAIPADAVVTGESTIRVINDDYEATGTGWRYSHKDKKVSIARNARVSFRAEFKDLLK